MATVGQMVGANIARLRKEQGLSQRELVARLEERLGISVDPATVARLENGGRRITVDDLVTYAYVLGADAVHLLAPQGDGDLELSDVVAISYADARSWLQAGVHPDDDLAASDTWDPVRTMAEALQTLQSVDFEATARGFAELARRRQANQDDGP